MRFQGGGYPSGLLRNSGVDAAGWYRVRVTGYAHQSKHPIVCSIGGESYQRGSERPTYTYASFAPGEPTVVEFETWIEKRWPQALQSLLPDYLGPVGIDCMVYREADGSLAWSPVVEVNVRMSMGRVALELMAKSRPGRRGRLQILRKASVSDEQLAELQSGSLDGGSVLLNDPTQAKEFYVAWAVS